MTHASAYEMASISFSEKLNTVDSRYLELAYLE